MKITGAQIRAARGFLDWTISDLATAAGVSDSTIRSIEGPDSAIIGGLAATLEYRARSREESIKKLASALTAAGITFLAPSAQGPGLRGRAAKD